ncbi:MAG TPA: methylated-DNA--[protein]-cysteine S-methyltransferase [Casimicrobiaceae bacterium]|nr:methylated-DNA--[protein]-cysteine S-methyltransferase [Casimicrobiaceae bacterium]
MNAIHCTTIDTPLGAVLLAASGYGLRGVWFDGQRHFAGRKPEWIDGARHPVLRATADQLAAYFTGTLERFDVPLDAQGTPFQRAVWRAIAAIPYGATQSYAALAAAAGAPGAARAAGAATGRNPLGIIVPCHRVVGAQGALTGYAGGLPRKRALLALEARQRPLLRDEAIAGAHA